MTRSYLWTRHEPAAEPGFKDFRSWLCTKVFLFFLFNLPTHLIQCNTGAQTYCPVCLVEVQFPSFCFGKETLKKLWQPKEYTSFTRKQRTQNYCTTNILYIYQSIKLPLYPITSYPTTVYIIKHVVQSSEIALSFFHQSHIPSIVL